MTHAPIDDRAHILRGQDGDVLNPSAPSGKERKYARPERERRFLLRTAPPGPVARVVEITDRYITGTRLRLRRASEAGVGGGTVHKLTQKVPALTGGPGLITTIYLSAEEHEIFAQLPAGVLHKTRSSVPPLAQTFQ